MRREIVSKKERGGKKKEGGGFGAGYLQAIW